MDIQIGKDQGISQAIKAKLVFLGAKEDAFKGSVWNEINNIVKEDENNTYVRKNKSSKMSDVWNNLKTNYKTFEYDIIKLSNATWNKLLSLVGLAPQPIELEEHPPLEKKELPDIPEPPMMDHIEISPEQRELEARFSANQPLEQLRKADFKPIEPIDIPKTPMMDHIEVQPKDKKEDMTNASPEERKLHIPAPEIYAGERLDKQQIYGEYQMLDKNNPEMVKLDALETKVEQGEDGTPKYYVRKNGDENEWHEISQEMYEQVKKMIEE